MRRVIALALAVASFGRTLIAAELTGIQIRQCGHEHCLFLASPKASLSELGNGVAVGSCSFEVKSKANQKRLEMITAKSGFIDENGGMAYFYGVNNDSNHEAYYDLRKEKLQIIDLQKLVMHHRHVAQEK